MRACVLTLFILSIATLAIGQGDENLLPSRAALVGWEKSGKAKTFTGSELYGYIDGGAEIFFEYGFSVVTVERYTKGKDELAVELYQMSDPVAALGIYLSRCGQETPDARLMERHTAGRHQLVFVRERFFCIIDNLSGKVEHARPLIDIAQAVGAWLPENVPINVFDQLPNTGLIKGTERIIRGPLALQSIITLGEGNVLNLGHTIIAVAASYQSETSGTSTLIVVRYPDKETASRTWNDLWRNLDPEIKVAERNQNCAVFRDYSSKWGEIRIIGELLQIRVGLSNRPLLP